MGLFTNNKKLCPICGNPTPRLLPTKIEDQPICKECDKKIDLPSGTERNMTLSDFKEYLTLYEENQAKRSLFHLTYRYGRFSDDPLLLDEENGLIRLQDKDACWAIEKKHLKSFRILEEEQLLFESGNGVLKHYPSEIPYRAEELRPVIAQFQSERREYERREEMERAYNRDESTEERRSREQISSQYRPRFQETRLFSGFRIQITLDHPYWTFHEIWCSAPELDCDYPNLDKFLKSYLEQTEELHTLAVKLMYLIDPDAKEVEIDPNGAPVETVTPTPPVDVVAEIKRYKELLEQGILTEEEFALKKRQLLGI